MSQRAPPAEAFPSTLAVLEVLRVHEGKQFVPAQVLEQVMAELDRELQKTSGAQAAAQAVNAIGYLATKATDITVLRPVYEAMDALFGKHMPWLEKLMSGEEAQVREGFEGRKRDFSRMLAPPPTAQTSAPVPVDPSLKVPKNYKP